MDLGLSAPEKPLAASTLKSSTTTSACLAALNRDPDKMKREDWSLNETLKLPYICYFHWAHPSKLHPAFTTWGVNTKSCHIHSQVQSCKRSMTALKVVDISTIILG
jgi:hypothetical protein